MKKLYIVAALLMATTSAQAGGISFQINGERIRVEAPRNCNAISCVKVISPGYTGTLGNVDLKGMGKKKDDDDVVTSAPAAPPAPAPAQAAAPQPPAPAPAAATPAPAPTTVATATPARTEAAPPAPPSPPAPSRPRPRRSRPRWPQPRPTRTRRSASGRRKRTRATCASRNAAPICAAIPSTPAQNPDQHEAAGSKWTGRIHDPDSGRNYDSTIALKSTNSLKVQGCAFGGMFCGGQTWKRVS